MLMITITGFPEDDISERVSDEFAFGYRIDIGDSNNLEFVESFKEKKDAVSMAHDLAESMNELSTNMVFVYDRTYRGV